MRNVEFIIAIASFLFVALPVLGPRVGRVVRNSYDMHITKIEFSDERIFK
jgi:hypothetical protein